MAITCAALATIEMSTTFNLSIRRTCSAPSVEESSERTAPLGNTESSSVPDSQSLQARLSAGDATTICPETGV